MPATVTSSNTAVPTLFLQAGDHTYAYRRFGGGSAPPLLCLQHFTGTLDNWDPAVTDPLALDREVILFENAGIGRSIGTVPESIAGMTQHVFRFLDGLGLSACDVLGFSLGGMIAQQIAKDRPSIIRRMILVGTAPRGGEDIMQEAVLPIYEFRHTVGKQGRGCADCENGGSAHESSWTQTGRWIRARTTI